MRNQVFETLVGLAVVIVAVGFLYYAVGRTNVGAVEGYAVTAEFSRIDGISVGSDVRIAGVKIGSVASLELNQQTYLADITLSIDESVALPSDTLAKIESESLLGGQYVALEPGAEEDLLTDGDKIAFTQSSPSLSDLLGQVVFSGGDGG
ncbi:MAG: outer membrane lipid asymmetry maintenance protein MlaD [Alphaproteobacteria bacterium]|nr:outer membrane lipid asymmetry maintenance protein MlaD [Alphaproteobacteria bacterium SS10]